jgi:Rieske Fe-S protein
MDRLVFLHRAALGLGGILGTAAGLPAAALGARPRRAAFEPLVDLGPISNFPEGQYVIAKFLLDPTEGELSRRAAYVRNNGLIGGVPSFTILSSRCVHVGCPTFPNGPVFAAKRKRVGRTTLEPAQPAGFGCPCHGGQYDTEGNRTAGPPVRALDRYSFGIAYGRLILGPPYSVSHVDGTGARARVHAYELADPGQHVDGPESLLYPFRP